MGFPRRRLSPRRTAGRPCRRLRVVVVLLLTALAAAGLVRVASASAGRAATQAAADAAALAGAADSGLAAERLAQRGRLLTYEEIDLDVIVTIPARARPLRRSGPRPTGPPPSPTGSGAEAVRHAPPRPVGCRSCP